MRESASCVYIPNIIPSNQYNIQYQPVCLEASEHQFIVTIMFSFPHLFNASQGEMLSWGFLKEILFVYDCAIVWLQCPHSEFWLVLSCCYVFANVSVWCCLHATIMWQHVGSAAQALRKWLTRMRWHMCPACMMERKRLYLWEKCLCFWSERMVVCVSVWLHNPKVLACVTILRR